MGPAFNRLITLANQKRLPTRPLSGPSSLQCSVSAAGEGIVTNLDGAVPNHRSNPLEPLRSHRGPKLDQGSRTEILETKDTRLYSGILFSSYELNGPGGVFEIAVSSMVDSKGERKGAPGELEAEGAYQVRMTAVDSVRAFEGEEDTITRFEESDLDSFRPKNSESFWSHPIPLARRDNSRIYGCAQGNTCCRQTFL